MANVLISYEGRERLSVDLSCVDPGKRVIRGDTLYLRPNSTKVLTEEEWAVVEKNCPKEQRRFLRKHEDKRKDGKALKKVQEVETVPVHESAEKTAEGVKKRAERLAKAKAEVKGPPRVVVDGPPNPVLASPVAAKAADEGKAGDDAEKAKAEGGKDDKGEGPLKKKKKKEATSAKSD